MARITLERLRKVFDAGTVAVGDLDLDMLDGERVVLVGPSGSGKSTVLRMIAGLEPPTDGRVRLDGQDVTDQPPERRDLAMVFQNYALYPHKTVRENLAFGLEMRKVARPEITRRVTAAAETLGIGALLDRMPASLSGGQRQRVALGRAIVREPRAFLFDEPLSNLDPRLRGEARAEILTLHARLSTTMVYVTHDQEEAMTIGQRIAVLRDGRLEQLAAPMRLYDEPANIFVAGFIGSPPMNLLPGRLEPGDGRLWFVSRDRRLWPFESRPSLPSEVAASGVHFGIRPQDLVLQPDAGGDVGAGGRVVVVEPLGHTQIVHVDAGEGLRLTALLPSERRFPAGTAVRIVPRVERAHLFDERGRRVT
jgi:multiple sugar transport system ATP-binding protein